MSLKVRTERKRDGVISISLVGSIDRRTYSNLQEEADLVLSQKPNVVIFDMEYLDYINSLGARVLLSSRKKLTNQNCIVLFLKMQPNIKNIFRILDTLSIMKVFESSAQLVDYLDTLQKDSDKNQA